MATKKKTKKTSDSNAKRELHISRSTADENGIKTSDRVRDGVVFRAEVDDNDPATVSPEIAESAENATRKKGKAKKAAKPTTELTLATLASRYLEALEVSGAGPGTIASYGMELKLAQRELGSETQVALLTKDHVREFFNSDAVMKTRIGKPKAPPTFLKTQRVLRQALVWAASERLIRNAPIPDMGAAV